MSSKRARHLRAAALTSAALLAAAGSPAIAGAQTGSLNGELGLNLELLLGSAGSGEGGSLDGGIPSGSLDPGSLEPLSAGSDTGSDDLSGPG